MDEICVENVAEFCVQASDKIDAGCDVEEYEALVNQLQDQRAQLVHHVEYIDSLLDKLKGSAGATASEDENSYIAG